MRKNQKKSFLISTITPQIRVLLSRIRRRQQEGGDRYLWLMMGADGKGMGMLC
jgi:hypothetical protein